MDTLADSYVVASSRNAGAAAQLAEDKKTAKYTNLGQNYLFAPIAFETFGTWGKEALKILSAIGARTADNSGDPRCMELLRQRISVELQRGNAASVLGTLKEQKCFEKVFYCYS